MDVDMEVDVDIDRVVGMEAIEGGGRIGFGYR
jgi:hypothetical protein